MICSPPSQGCADVGRAPGARIFSRLGDLVGAVAKSLRPPTMSVRETWEEERGERDKALYGGRGGPAPRRRSVSSDR